MQVGHTALHHAAYNGALPSIVRLLLNTARGDAEALLLARDNEGSSILHYFAMNMRESGFESPMSKLLSPVGSIYTEIAAMMGEQGRGHTLLYDQIVPLTDMVIYSVLLSCYSSHHP